MLRIRERELNYYTNNCLAISTSSALLAGFAWYGLTEVPFDSNASAVTQTLYLVVTTLIMGLELLTVVNATLCAILGPGLALRGPDGSMHNAVQGMMTHYRFTLACFTLGLVCFMLSALLCKRRHTIVDSHEGRFAPSGVCIRVIMCASPDDIVSVAAASDVTLPCRRVDAV
jgi:hypothetical protein